MVVWLSADVRISVDKVTLHQAAKDWRRRPWCPHHTWLWTPEADRQPLNPGLNSAWRLAQDRRWCRQLVETAMLQSGARIRWWWWGTVSTWLAGHLWIAVCNQPPRSTQPGHLFVLGAMSTSESWRVNRHTTQCTRCLTV